MGGSGTGQSISITKDGNTTLMFHGTVSSSVIYKGKFENPIHGYFLQGNKIYQVNPDGSFRKGCRGEGTLCESVLYNPASTPPPSKRYP